MQHMFPPSPDWIKLVFSHISQLSYVMQCKPCSACTTCFLGHAVAMSGFETKPHFMNSSSLAPSGVFLKKKKSDKPYFKVSVAQQLIL